MSVTHEHAVEVDTRLAAIFERQGAIALRHANNMTSLHSLTGERGNPNVKYGAKGYWPTTNVEAEANARAGTNVKSYSAGTLARTLEEIDALRAEALELTREASPLEAEFRADPWPRFFLVQNVGGHIHRSMSCVTTFPTTRWSWLPGLSGLGEDAAVAEQGPRLCSVCFPSAPVEWTLGLPAKVDPNRCPGSGQQGLNQNFRYHTPRGTCPVCGEYVAISTTGKLRPHKTPKGA